METKIRIIDILDRNKTIHIRELARLVKTSYNNTVRNLKILEKERVITKEKEANLVKISLKNTPLTIAYLKQVHTHRFLALPIKSAITEFLKELKEKPLITLIFGSYAKGNYRKESDIDILLVFQAIRESKDIENTAKRVSMRTNTRISPVYTNYPDFEENFMNKYHEFSKEIRKNTILLLGLEYYYDLLWRFQQ